MYYNEKHKKRVIERGDGYTYIGSYRRKEETIDGKNKKHNANYIRVKCPYCGNEYDVQNCDFFIRKIICGSCCNLYENSFAYHIQMELGEGLNKYWDWKENDLNPYLIYVGSSTNKVKLKCNKTNYHDNYTMFPNMFKRGDRCPQCTNHHGNVHPNESFGQWLIDEFGKNAIKKYWSPKNTLDPFKLSKGSDKYIIWMLCKEKDYHNDNGGYETTPNEFYRGNRCPYCSGHKTHPKDSFGQWLIDTYGNNAVEKYWSSKNTINPFEISPNSHKNIWIYCQEKDYHNDNGGYKTSPNSFYRGQRCGYCYNSKIHPLDSFGMLYPEKAKYWSKNNKKTPFEVAPKTTRKYKFICEKCGEEFERNLNDLNRIDSGVVCINCNSSSLEQATKNVLDGYNIKYEREYKYNDLKGIRGGILRFDFYLPKYNTVIECQGEQHKKRIKGWQTEEGFKIQKQNDLLKRNYCDENDIKLIEIWYNEINDIENILIEKLHIENN